MKNVSWTNNGNEYRLITLYGVAIINEIRDDIGDKNAIGARFIYPARFEKEDGTVILSKFTFREFDDAEGWLFWGIIMEIDQPSGVEADTKKLFSSLKLSEKLLPANHFETHQERIKLIRQILQGKNPERDQANYYQKRWAAFYKYSAEFPPLPWEQQGDEYQTEIDGIRLVIKEIRNKDKWIMGRVSTYFPKICDKNGIVLKSYVTNDFEEAEHWLISDLFDIINPLQGRVELEELLSTLDLCVQVLPDNSDPIHYLRLEWMKNRISEILL